MWGVYTYSCFHVAASLANFLSSFSCFTIAINDYNIFRQFSIYDKGAVELVSAMN